jgi:FkbM family methyltransferase
MYYSQSSQDKFLEENIFKGYKNGFFVDVGAHDGITFNNTLYFEKENNWTGINIEPIASVYNKLVINRPNCINLPYAICNNDGEASFICNEGYTEMISGLKDTYYYKHNNRLENELKSMGGESNIINVKTKKLETIFDDNNVKNIDYLSIDVEGAEFEVIKSINFDKVFIDVIEFEDNYEETSEPIVEYLTKLGYSTLYKSMDIFMIHENSLFL